VNPTEPSIREFQGGGQDSHTDLSGRQLIGQRMGAVNRQAAHTFGGGILPEVTQVRNAGALVLAQADPHSELATKLDGQRVVIPVHMGHEDLADVGQCVAELGRGRLQLGSGRAHRPPAIDHQEAVSSLEQVCIHRVQAVPG